MRIISLTAMLLILLIACTKEEEPVLSSFKNISEFKIDGVLGEINNDDKSILLFLPSGTDISNLSPVITVSSKASVEPASGVSQDFTNPVNYKVTAEDGSSVDYTVTVFNVCAREENIHSFTYDGKTYNLIKENKNWAEASACAVELGGYLAEINSAEENNAIFSELSNNAGIDISKTISYDGGSASYVWIGGNDVETEGSWIWDGDNDGNGIHFWQGAVDGSAVGGLYTNWGIEPDNSSNQDALGLALTEWPKGSGSLGIAGQWNDVNFDNPLYFVVEFD